MNRTPEICLQSGQSDKGNQVLAYQILNISRHKIAWMSLTRSEKTEDDRHRYAEESTL